MQKGKKLRCGEQNSGDGEHAVRMRAVSWLVTREGRLFGGACYGWLDGWMVDVDRRWVSGFREELRPAASEPAERRFALKYGIVNKVDILLGGSTRELECQLGGMLLDRVSI